MLQILKNFSIFCEVSGFISLGCYFYLLSSIQVTEQKLYNLYLVCTEDYQLLLFKNNRLNTVIEDSHFLGSFSFSYSSSKLYHLANFAVPIGLAQQKSSAICVLRTTDSNRGYYNQFDWKYDDSQHEVSVLFKFQYLVNYIIFIYLFESFKLIIIH